MSGGDAISTRGLSKRYGEVLAVDALDLRVRRGEIYGLLGRNGAGKTTTIRMLLGLIRPSAGDVEVLGRRMRPGECEVLGRVGHLVESAAAYPNLTVRENLEVQRRLTDAPRTAVDEAVELMRLESYADRRAGVLSLGNRQRLSLARALLHHPDLLVLDEPANALDPAGIVEVRELLRALARDHGVTVFMSSHILAEVAHLADRIGIVHDGRLLEELDRKQLREKERLYVVVRASQPERAAALLAGAGYAHVEQAAGQLRVFGAEDHTADLARTLVGAGLDLNELTAVHEDLEAHFLRLTGERAMTFPQVLATEFLKLRRSKVTWLSLGALSLGPLAVALFMWIVREPGRARQLGLLGSKADLAGISATWPSYFSMLAMIVGMGGLLLLAFIVAFIFAREYVEGTAKNLLALPVGRHWIVLAKLAVAGVWWAALVVAVVAETLLIGSAMALPGFSWTVAGGGVRDVVVVAVVVFMLAPVVAWIATLARGYLAPLGFALAMLVLAQVFGKTGWGPWFPWSIVASFVGSVGGRVAPVGTQSLVVVLLAFLAGIAATIAQLRYADSAQ